MSYDFLNSTNDCSSQCFCHLSRNKFFLTKLLFIQCNNEYSSLNCYQNQFLPSTYSIIPLISNHSSCQNNEQCLHILYSNQTCQYCQLELNHSNQIRTCFHFCEQIPSCGFTCIQQAFVLSIVCRTCSNVTCRCIHPIPSCLLSIFETTTPRWMQKRGFPAAAILALLVLAVGLLVVAMKLIYRQLDLLDRRHSLVNQQSLLVSQTG